MQLAVALHVPIDGVISSNLNEFSYNSINSINILT